MTLPTFIENKLNKGVQNGSFLAYLVFVDIKGFTSLTERLMQHGKEGAEVLSFLLNDIFSPLVQLVYEMDGFIPHFAGDAFTGIFAHANEQGVVDTALMIREIFERHPIRKTKFGDFEVNVRLGLTYGSVEWGVVGGNKKEIYYKGVGVEQAAESERHAGAQEIVFDSYFKSIAQTGDLILEELDGQYFLLKGRGMKDEGRRTKDETANDEAMKDEGQGIIVEGIVTKIVEELSINESSEDLLKGANAIEVLSNRKPDSRLGEFRNVVTVFIAFEHVDTFEDLGEFLGIVLEQFDLFSGYFKEFDFGDKGSLAVGFFGAPVAFENNITRALEFVLSLKEQIGLLQAKKPFQFKIGMTSGVAYTGIVGGIERSQYAVVGNLVNLAARLTLHAHWDEVLTDGGIADNRLFSFQSKGLVRYKGISKAVQTFLFSGRKIEEKAFFTGLMIGRRLELEQLISASLGIFAGDEPCKVVYIFGEPGVGKSRLVYEFRLHSLGRYSIDWATCQSDQILSKPFNPFVYFLRNYFKQSPERSPVANIHTFETIFEQLVRALPESGHLEGSELIRTQSVLASLVGIQSVDSLWEQLDAKGRYENTLSALVNLFAALALVRPLVIELEDAHWLDESSNAFLRTFIPKVAKLPILIVATSRYSDEGDKQWIPDPIVLQRSAVPSMELDLNIFTTDTLKEFAETRLRSPIDEVLAELLWRTTNGNPFYAEQILAYFMENNLLEKVDDRFSVKDTTIKISTSISAVLTARIDRLSNLVKETVKAAAVIGREFDLTVLSEVMMKHEAFIGRKGNSKVLLKEQIQTAERVQIWRAMNELRYIFRHTLLREAVYDMQMHVRLRELHSLIAQAIEKIYFQNIEDSYIDLAFHYEQAADLDKTNFYLKKAADHARSNYQNRQALEFYDRLYKNIKDTGQVEEIIKLLFRRGELLQILGKWHDSEICFHEALFKSISLSDVELNGRAHNSLGALLMLKGSYTEAQGYLEKAAALFEQVSHALGISRSYGNLGNLYFRQGQYEEAKDYFTRSLHIARENGIVSNPQIVSNLGLTYMNQGNYTEGILCQMEELEACERRNDQPGMAILYINLGIVYFERGNEDEALRCYDSGLALSRELGNRQLTSIVIGCIGNVWRLKGNFEKAAAYLEEDMQICREIGDRQGIAIVSELMGKLYADIGMLELAQQYYQESLIGCRELHYQKGVAKALHGLGEVYTKQNEFALAVPPFNEAIEISRNAGNLLILGQCLVDKGNALIQLGDNMNAAKLRLEAVTVAKTLGNEKLMSQVNVFVDKFDFSG